MGEAVAVSLSLENGKPNSGIDARDSGVAAIKHKYLTTKEQFHSFIDAEGKETKREVKGGQMDSIDADTGDRIEPEPKKMKQEDKNEETQEIEETKEEKKRARGQNKRRPFMKPSAFDGKKLCPSITQESTSKCYFGENCKFLHDVCQYMAEKPADLGEKCHLFEMFGKCIYGVTCRFAKGHLGEDYRNLVNEELVKQWEGKGIVRNSLSKDLKQRLQKRKVPFEKSDHFLKQLNKLDKAGTAKSKWRDSKAKQVSGSDADSSSQAPEVGQVASGLEDTKNRELECLPDPAVKCPPSLESAGGGQEYKNRENACQVEAEKGTPAKTIGPLTDEDVIKLRSCEKKTINFRNKLYLAPLTTCGNLPFRRICKRFGADVTCGEMAVCTNLLQGQSSEWALLKRHHTEDLFGIQLEGAFPDTMTKCAELLNQTIDVDFVDINVGCPIDLIYNKGGGCGLMNRLAKFEQIVKGMDSVLDFPLTVKIRTGVQEKVNIAHKLIPGLQEWGVSLVTLHGRSREQRYTKAADWSYIDYCAKIASPLPLFGNGDILSYEDANRAMQTAVSGIMIARGALVKPWLFTEIKEQRHWDISSTERFEILKDFTNNGLEHWGSDTQGVEKTRRFLLEWLSFLCRYIPVGLLEHIPQKINERPPYYMGRDYLETLMASQNVSDWIKISEMLLGPVPPSFTFLPKHKANSYK